MCTNAILTGLGQIYVGDERFTQQIDSFGGVGTARFVSQAINFFTAKSNPMP